MAWDKALILGIETSCDETAVAFLRGGRECAASAVASQTDLHRRFGGVVPEVACRAHMEALLPLLEGLMKERGLAPEEIDGIAVTNRPGLIGALLVGVSAAKALAYAWEKPLVGVNHIEAHISAARLTEPGLAPPFVALVVSGGHTTLYLVNEQDRYELLGTTRDDAAGEAFDKAAAVLDLPYPGGPSIEKAALQGNPRAFPWKNACLPDDGRDFSFSGIKTAVLYAARGQKAGRKGPLLLSEKERADAAASFQHAVAHALVKRTLAAAERHGVGWIALGGGVAANKALRAALEAGSNRAGIRTAIPPLALCTDNAVMVAARGWELFARGTRDTLDLDASARALPGTFSPPEGAGHGR
ncbi:MAG: tRNA (adenosine(37)-N6)-threonylcarbamoyltransferase complex transferase subunit TsaD [Planctomycetota bacterium]